MEKHQILAVLMAFAPFSATAGARLASEQDSTAVEHLQEVVVQGVRAQKNAPYAVASIQAAELQQFSKTGRELPLLFSQTPGVLAWSENGLGTGTTYMRIRGAGDSRINVTLDGVPLNSPEDQCVFWANMNSYGSLLGSVQIQRGVGASTNGDGAFGGSISLSSKAPSSVPTGEISVSTGSYNTFNVGASVSTGLLWRHWTLDGAYHETNTNGYIHGTGGRSGSYYAALRYLTDNFSIAYKNFGNFEKTGQAWNGVTAGDNDLSLMDGTYGEPTGIKTYKDLYKAGLGRYNSLYERLRYDDNGHFARDADGNYLTERYTLTTQAPTPATGYWDKATDNFWQTHNLLTAAWEISPRWTTTATLHYTHGYGYYREFRYDNKIKKIGLPNAQFNGEALSGVKRTDWVRKKGLKQDVYGLVWNANYRHQDWNVIGGLSIQNFSGNHFGYATYVSNEQLRSLLLKNGDYHYYDSDARKFDGNAYLKAAYRITSQWEVFADVQFRHVSYKTDGYNDKFLYNDATGLYDKHFLDIDEKYDFFNPKAGFSFRQGGHRVYGSVALSHREPERNNFTDNGNYPAPKAESLTDYELGYQFTAPTWNLSVNGYFMDYDDQFVQTGQVSDIGEPLTTNIKSSYRLGVEISGAWMATPWLTIEANAALSQNKIKDFDEFVEDWDDWKGNPDAAKYHCDGNGDKLRQFHYDHSTLAFSPSAILNGFLHFRHRQFQATWHTNFVSRQYLDNTENRDRSLPAFSQSNLSLGYTVPVHREKIGIRSMILGLNLSNLFNAHYAASGWVYSAVAESYGHTPDNRYYQIGFIPMSGFTLMGSLTLKF
ncbi:MAG: TonB-dependent receptor [Prevotella sp.]|nr:TonB-dependent receptor [Prevotella sp.]